LSHFLPVGFFDPRAGKNSKLRAMNAKALAVLGGSLLLALVAPARVARAADAVAQITALDDAATASYSDGDFDKMKKQLTKALALGKGSLASHPIMARVYLHLGVLWVDGLENRAVGVKYFSKALKIRPDIEVRSNMATKTVMSAFTEAGQEASAAEEEAPPRESPKASRKEPVVEKDDEPAAEPERRPSSRASSSEKCRGDSEVADVKKQAREEFDRLERQLTMSKDALAKERVESDKFRTAKMDLERQLAEAKQRVTSLERDTSAKDKRVAATADRETKERQAKEALAKEKTEKDSLLLDTAQRVQQLEKDNAEKDKMLAAGAAREKQAREANEKLDREKREALDKLAQEKREATEKLADAKREHDRQVAEMKQQLAQIERDKADKEKQLASTTDRERKERETREKLERDRQANADRERERNTWAERARAERDKLEAIPPLPSRIPEPVHCAIPDEVQGGADFFVNCVTQPSVRAKTIVFYYRPANATVYNSVVMDPTKKGWSRAVITANKLNGKLLQYYAEARDTHDTVSATNGKATSPNIVPIAGPGKK
jgi:hypothetical protein